MGDNHSRVNGVTRREHTAEPSMPLKELHGSFVFFCCGAASESA